MSSSNQSFLNSSRRSELFSNRSRGNDSMASRQSKEDSLVSASRFKSSCYEGKVSFGGASAKRMRFSQTLPYSLANKPSTITRIKDSDIKRRNEENELLSKTTQKMFDNLNKISSPLEDAKKVPVFDSINQSSNEKFLIDINKRPIKRLSSLRTPKIPNLIPTSSPIDREKLQLKFDELENTRHHSFNSSFKQNSSFNNVMTDSSINYLNQQHSNSAGGKMKSKLTRSHGLSRDEQHAYQPEHLPNIPLKINNNSLPEFNFNKRSHVNIRNDELKNKKRPLVFITQVDDDTYEDEFKFSAPKAIKLEKISESFLEKSIRNDLARNQPKSITSNQINFPIPIKNNQPEKSLASSPSKTTTTTSFPSLQFTSSTVTSNLPANLETNKTVEINKLDKIDTDFNPKENKATLANTLTKVTKSGFNFDGLNKEALISSINKTWECDTCSVRNELTSNKCCSCELPRLKEKTLNNSIYSDYKFSNISLEKKSFNAFKFDSNKSTNLEQINSDNTSNSALTNILNTVNSISSPITTNILSNQTTSLLTTTNATKLTSDKTTDSSLSAIATTKESNEIKPFNFVTNEDVDKLNSSFDRKSSSFTSGAKDSTTPATATSNPITLPTNSWGTQFQKPKDTWECKSCLVVNKLADKKCVCCETANPAIATQEESKPKTSTGNSLTLSSNGGFKFNLDASSTPAKSGFGSLFDSSKLNTDNTQSSTKGFSFVNTVADKSDNKTAAAPIKFGGFGAASSTLSSTQSTTTNKPASFTQPLFGNEATWKCKNCSTVNDKKINNCSKCEQSKGNDDSGALNSGLSNSNITKSSETSSLFGKAISDVTSNNKTIFPSNGSVFSGFLSTTNNEVKKPEEKASFVFGQPQSISLTNSTTNLNSNNETKFNLTSNSLTNNSALNPQSSSFFSTSGQTNSFNQFGSNKNQFSLSAIQPASTNSIFSSGLTNGFAAAKDNNSAGNSLFSSTINQQPAINQAPVNNFGSAFLQPVPSTFNFGQPADQSKSVFQFAG